MTEHPSSNSTTIRPGEKAIDHDASRDTFVQFIGRIHTPFRDRSDCPRQGDVENGPVCTLEIDPAWAEALTGIGHNEQLEVLYWLDRARRDLVVQNPRHAKAPAGTFSLRSPNRPNPVGVSVVQLLSVEGCTLKVRGLDCLDGTPLIDIKPARSSFLSNIRENAPE